MDFDIYAVRAVLRPTSSSLTSMHQNFAGSTDPCGRLFVPAEIEAGLSDEWTVFYGSTADDLLFNAT